MEGNDMEAFAISAKDLKKKYGSKAILNSATAHFPAGQLTCIIGRSGSGKSTFLKCLNGLELADSGVIQAGQIEINCQYNQSAVAYNHIRSRVGMVFQNFQLFPHLSLLQNVALALTVVKKQSPKSSLERAAFELERVQLGAHKEKFPSQLSGGQQQRGAIARALALDPLALLYDEPTSALDVELVDDVLQIVAELSQKKLTQILVTHELYFVKKSHSLFIILIKGKY
jgi:ABC-type polar amino acid transport system ATPase subunit